MSAGTCSDCGAAYKPNAAFCSACGKPRTLDEPSQLSFIIKFFVAQLTVMLPFLVYTVHLHGDPFVAVMGASAALFVVTLAAAGVRRPLWWPLYKRAGFGPLGYALIVLAAPVVLTLVLGYVHGLATAFGLHPEAELEGFKGHAFVWQIILLAALPPVMEELAFRGIIFTGLTKTLGIAESMIISSFAFALLHLSIPSIVTHLPLGLYFCFLRHRSQSLWPSMLAHCLHNVGVIVVGYLGWA